jgi:hypothetical protein
MEDYRCVAHRVCSEGASDTTKRWYLGYMKHCIIENYDGQTSWFNIKLLLPALPAATAASFQIQSAAVSVAALAGKTRLFETGKQTALTQF